MNRSARILLTLILAAGLLLPGLVVRAVGLAASTQPHHFVRLPAEALDDLDALALQPFASVDYGAFSWLELSQMDFARLEDRVPYQEVVEGGTINLPKARFDPVVDGEPYLPAGMRADPDETGFRLVQMQGPVKDAWLEAIQATEAELLQYYPHNTYLVWASSAQIVRIQDLASVRWTGLFHPAYRISPALQGASGLVENVAITFYNDGRLQETLNALDSLGGSYVQHFPAQPDRKFITAIYRLDASRLDDLARLSTVWAVEYSSPRPGFDDEVGAQIVAGNYTGGMPFTGYYTWLAEKGVDGSGITWADVDTGLNASHPDITGRAAAFISYPGAGPANVDPDGHGSHTAGAIFGDGAGGTGITDPNGFYWGTGMAPEALLVVQNAMMGSNWPPSGGWQVLSKDSVLNGALGSSNSWYTGAAGAQGYSAAARTHDIMMRDANFDTPAAAEPIIMVFSAGNNGPGGSTITEPKEAKNLISVGASVNYPRSGSSINDLAYFSSRGPALDGRLLPNVAAPGVQTASFNGSGATCGTPVSGPGSSYYNYCQGTSMAAPFISGSAALIADWWDQEGWGAPSPAMVKALLINGASDMVGGNCGSGCTLTNIPNNIQGWGRANLPEVIRPTTPAIYFDQETLFADTGEEWEINIGVIDPTQPLKISLAWSDAPGAVLASPALVNNLDLMVTMGGDTYYGNVFSSGWSTPGGAPDALNNIENVYIQAPEIEATITIQATNIAGDGLPYNGDTTDQDFALVCYNCSLGPDFSLAAAPADMAVCTPQSADFEVTIDSSLGFAIPVDLSAAFSPTSTMTTTFSANPVTPPGSSTLTVGNTGSASEGSYVIEITGVSPTKTHSTSVSLDVYAGLPAAPPLLTPADGAADQPVQPTLTWTAAQLPVTYTVEIALDEGFTQIVDSASGLTEPLYTLPLALENAERYYWRVRAENLCGAGEFSQPFSFSTLVRAADCPVDYAPLSSYFQDFETLDHGWTHSGSGDTWGTSDARSWSSNWSMHAEAPASVSDQSLYSPPITLPDLAPLTLQFYNYQYMENRVNGCYDGGLLEISTDGGVTWTQVETGLLTDPYDGPIASGAGNPLAGSDAWCGDPQNWLNSVVDLSAYAGQAAQLRFRLGTDSQIGREGWYIDDVRLQSCYPEVYSAGWEQDSTLAALPGETVTHTFTLKNSGLADVYDLELSGNAWPTTLVPSPTIALEPGESVQVAVQVQVPESFGETVIASDGFTLTAVSQALPSTAASVQGLTDATATAGVALDVVPPDGTGAPGATVLYGIMLTNTGTYTDTFTLEASGVWAAALSNTTSGTLGPGFSVGLTLQVSIPAGAAIGDLDTTTVVATSSLDGEVSAQVEVNTVAAVRYLYLPMIPASKSIDPLVERQ